MAYSDKVLDHYENPRNVGSLDKNDPNVGTGMVGAPACGRGTKLRRFFSRQLLGFNIGNRCFNRIFRQH